LDIQNFLKKQCLLKVWGCQSPSKLVNLFSLQTPGWLWNASSFLQVLLITRTTTDTQPVSPAPSRQASRFTTFPASIKQPKVAAGCKLQVTTGYFPRNNSYC
jgi:hypothetical protein